MGRRGRDQGYSFRSADFAGEHQDSGDRPCARGRWCARATRERLTDGTTQCIPDRSYQAFCRTDRDLIGRCLDGFPALHDRLSGAAGDFLTAEVLVRAPFGPSVLIRVDVDGLMRHLVDVACSWHERVAMVAGLAAPDTQRTRALELSMRSGTLLPGACDVLGAHLDALLTLEGAEMMRPQVSWLSSVTPDAIITGAWRDSLRIVLGGADAGNEILRLDFLGHAVLLETDPGPERLLGVPCRSCPGEPRTLRRASPPQHDGDPEWHSECMTCHDLMDFAEYTAWVKRNAAFYEARVTPAMTAAGIAA